MKNFIVLLLISILIFSIFSGCIDKNEKKDDTLLPTKNQEPVSIISIFGSINPKPDYYNNKNIDSFVFSGDTIKFDASDSYDPDGEIISYEWLLDESNNIDTGVIVSHKYNFNENSEYIPNIIQVILTIKDNNGSIAYDTFIIGILPKSFTYYLNSQSLSKQKPDSNSDKIKATFGRFRPIEKLKYILEEPVQLQKCKWNATIYIEKPILSFLSQTSLILYNSTGEKIAESNYIFRIFEFWKEKTITISGIIDNPNDFSFIEFCVYGFSFGQKINILYGDEKASFVFFDFTL